MPSNHDRFQRSTLQDTPEYEATRLPLAHLGSHQRDPSDAATPPFPIPPKRLSKARSLQIMNSSPGASPVERRAGPHYATPHSANVALEDTTLDLHTEPAGPTRILFDTEASIPVPPQPDPILLAAARDKHLQNVNQQRLRSKPSFIMAPFKKRQDKAVRRSAETAPSKVTYESIEDWVEQGINAGMSEPHPEVKARSSSNSLKNKIKRVFRKSSNSIPALPVQHLDATRDHFGDDFIREPTVASTIDGAPSQAPAEDVAYPAEPPDCTSQPQLSETRQRSYSAGSAASEGRASDGKSRVTSWSNSSAAGTVITREPAKRLTAIPENAAPSPTRFLGGLPETKHCDVFKKPMRRRRGSSEEERVSVDSQRVYSALMKRIDEAGLNTANNLPVPEAAASQKAPAAYDILPSQSRKSSISSGISRLTRATVRTVTQDRRPSKKAETADVTADSIGYPSAGQDHDGPPAVHSEDTGSSRSRAGAKGGRNKSLGRAAKTMPPSSRQPTNRFDKAENIWKDPLVEGDSPIFQPRIATHTMPSEDTFAHIRRRSPASEEALLSTPNAHELAGPARECAGPKQQIESNVYNVVSPSVYSRNTDGQSPCSNDSAISLVCGENDGTGTAVIITSHPVKSYALGSSRAPTRVHSGKSSKEWKAWLSKEISELEIENQEDVTINNFTDMRGRAEFPQDTAAKGINYTPSLFKGAQRPTLEERPSSVMNDRFPMLPIKPKAKRESTPPKDVDVASVATVEPSKACLPASFLRPKLEERSSSRMNDRFPMISTVRKGSKENIKVDTKAQRQRTPEAEAQPSKPTAKENVSNMLQVPPRRDLLKARSMQAMDRSPSPRSQTSLSHYTTTGEANRIEAVRSPTPNLLRKRQDRTVLRAKSALDMRGYTPMHLTPPQSKRKPIAGPVMEGDTLKMVLKGPYSPKLPTPGVNNENSPGTSSFAHTDSGAECQRPGSRLSEVAPSGGHRMADVFLSYRRNGVAMKEASESPAFL
ncbi:hypothetical protein W97_03765 [Coniosporium apollinis CBS 100218]|uniref:Uncharacterized protein n=1 Tax=Coniosporium apollinis (strain CBS 100218) TaxID=1168221 RepID=R7YRJ9_CONA1|nr:uncharacterized protein W97_03765 [Coniosporium apollinis CBS 100218]EON64532.1 hypothetical protein W97_03765 [Coniosporium apollinis CBS 100218]